MLGRLFSACFAFFGAASSAATATHQIRSERVRMRCICLRKPRRKQPLNQHTGHVCLCVAACKFAVGAHSTSWQAHSWVGILHTVGRGTPTASCCDDRTSPATAVTPSTKCEPMDRASVCPTAVWRSAAEHQRGPQQGSMYGTAIVQSVDIAMS